MHLFPYFHSHSAFAHCSCTQLMYFCVCAGVCQFTEAARRLGVAQPITIQVSHDSVSFTSQSAQQTCAAGPVLGCWAAGLLDMNAVAQGDLKRHSVCGFQAVFLSRTDDADPCKGVLLCCERGEKRGCQEPSYGVGLQHASRCVMPLSLMQSSLHFEDEPRLGMMHSLYGGAVPSCAPAVYSLSAVSLQSLCCPLCMWKRGIRGLARTKLDGGCSTHSKLERGGDMVPVAKRAWHSVCYHIYQGRMSMREKQFIQ